MRFGLLLAGVWAAVTTVGSTFVVSRFLNANVAPVEANKPATHQEIKTLRPISVPILRDGQLQGYVVLQLKYAIDAGQAVSDPDVYITDEVFRLLYGNQQIDLTKLTRIDLDNFLTEARKHVQERLKSDIVKELFIQEAHYVWQRDLKN